MFDWIPLEYYSYVYYNTLLFVVLLVLMHSYLSSIHDEGSFVKRNWFSLLFVTFIILYIGSRPISGRYFADMATYAMFFQNYSEGAPLVAEKDLVFEYFLMYSSYIMSVQMFFMLCAFIYVIPLYIVCKRFFKNYWFYGFLMLVLSMSFWAYGTNGIRNGIATSLFLYGLSCKKKYQVIAFFVLATMIHKSMSLPFAAYLITLYYNKTETYLKSWFLSIPLSLALGSFLEGFFLTFGFGDEDRLTGYLTAGDEYLDVAVKTGFRWDFVLYSATGVLAGYYFILRKKFNDPLYTQMFNIYLISNALWILVIRANFSNRFAYLSWFMLGIIIIYPLLKMEFIKKQHRFLGVLMFCYFIFTYILNFILSKK